MGLDQKSAALVALTLVATAAVRPASAARNFDIDIDNIAVAAAAVDQPLPSFPDTGIRTGQEGWVRLHYVIAADGRAVDPIVVDSSGGVEFERSARAAVSSWRFEPPGAELANNTSDIRFEMHRRDRRSYAASSNFLRRYRRIMTHIYNEEIVEAREQIDDALALGGWNLYESTMLSLMVGRVAGAEGNDTAKLQNYRRALRMDRPRAVGGEDRRDLLVRLFRLQFDRAQYAAAMQTLELLRAEAGSQQDVAGLEAEARQAAELLAGQDTIAAQATLYNPCSCDEGEPLWSYAPSRRTFSFSGLNGNVERFEVRCERDRFGGAVETDRRWSLPGDPGQCIVFVFGEDGAGFEFVEHGDAEPNDAIEPVAAARSDGLDR